MSGRCESLGQHLKAWAADQLLVEAGAAPEHVQTAYFRQVQQADGAPNLAAREALLILTGRTAAAKPTLALAAVEEKLQREVDAFASRFFHVPIAERKAEWARLRVCCQGLVRLDARLSAMRDGLHVVLPNFDHDKILGLVSEAVFELFVLRPAAHAARRQELLRDMASGDERDAWAKAALVLSNRHPAIAELEPWFISRLIDADALAADKKQLNRKMRTARQPAGPGNRRVAESSNRRWPWIGLVVAALFFARFLTTVSTPSNTRPNFAPQQSPFIVPPQVDLKDFDKGKKPPFGINGKEPKGVAADPFEEFLKRAKELRQKQEGQRVDAPKDKKDPP